MSHLSGLGYLCRSWRSAFAGSSFHTSIGAHPLSRKPLALWPATPVRNFVWREHLPQCDLHPPQVSGPCFGSSRTNSTSLSPSGNPVLILHGHRQALLLFEVRFPCSPSHFQSPGGPTQFGAIIHPRVPDWSSWRGQGRGRVLSVSQGPSSRGGSLSLGSAKVCRLLASLPACLLTAYPSRAEGKATTPACTPPVTAPISPWGGCLAPALGLPTAPGSDLTSQQHFLLLATPFFLKHPFLWTRWFSATFLAISS